MKKDEIRQKKEEVLSMLPTKSKKELEEDYREMAKEFIDSSIYIESVYIATRKELGEEKTDAVFGDAEFIVNEWHTEREMDPENKAFMEKLIANKGEQNYE